VFLFTTMRQDSTRCPNKLCRPLEIGTTIAEACMAKMRSMAEGGAFTGWGVAIHEADTTLVSAARLQHAPVMWRRPESVQGMRPLSVIFQALENVEDDWVMWVNPCTVLFPAKELMTAMHYFRPDEMRSLTPVVRVQNWLWHEEGRPVNQVDHTLVSTQHSAPLFACCHAFHIFNRLRVLQEDRYWSGDVADPVLYYSAGPEEWYMDVDTTHDFRVMDQYLMAEVRTLQHLQNVYCTA
jgi:CMP-N-acetylneuraminic acid synthetase